MWYLYDLRLCVFLLFMMFVEDSVDLLLRMIHAIYHRYNSLDSPRWNKAYIKIHWNEGMIQGLWCQWLQPLQLTTNLCYYCYCCYYDDYKFCLFKPTWPWHKLGTKTSNRTDPPRSFPFLGVTAVKTMLSASRKSLSGLMDKTFGRPSPNIGSTSFWDFWRCVMDVFLMVNVWP